MNIIQLIAGLLLLLEVCGRIFGWTYPTEFTYRICRPFRIPFPMMVGVSITFAEIVIGAVLTYRGCVELIGLTI